MKTSNLFLTALPFLLLFCALAAVFYVARKRERPGEKYDERQLAAQGKAYKTAFFVLLGYSLATGLFDFATGIRWSDLLTEQVVGVCLAVTVFAIRCILSDAYLPLREKPVFVASIFGLVAVLNLISGVRNLLRSNYAVSQGRLNFRAVNLVIGVTFTVILAVFLLKLARDAKTKAE